MKYNLDEKITEFGALYNNYVMRDGYIFTSWNDRPNIFDVLVIKNPYNASGNTSYFPDMRHTLEEHIRMINEEGIKRVLIITDDLSFITSCPSLKMFSIFPANTAQSNFDFSPLYRMNTVEVLNCHLSYGEKEELSSSIDYSQIKGLVDVAVYGKGHMKYENVETLEKLWISNEKKHKDLLQISCSRKIKDLTIMQCSIKSLNGIDKLEKIQSLDLSYNCLKCSNCSSIFSD